MAKANEGGSKDKPEELLRKVRHLRNLAERAGTLAEAEAAAAQADAIIQKYRLAEADLEAAGEAPLEPCESAAEPLDTNVCAGWRFRLAARLTQHYGCFLFKDGRNGNLPIFGRASDVMIVRQVYAAIVLDIERLAQREHGRADKNTFRWGAVKGFLETLRKSTTEETAKHSASAALTILDRAKEAEAHARVAFPSLRKVSLSGHSGSRESYERGQAAGRSMQGNDRALGVGSGRLLPAKRGV